MWPHLYTPTGLRVGAPQTRNIEYLGYLRSKSYEKRLKTIVIDRPTKKWFGPRGLPNPQKLLRITVSELFSLRTLRTWRIDFHSNDVFRKLSVMKLRSWWHLNGHCTTIFHRVMAVFVFWPPKYSEIPILEQKYKFHLTHCRNKVVRYEITSPCIFESSLYDDFPRRYGRYECTRFHAFSRNCCFGVEISILDDAL